MEVLTRKDLRRIDRAIDQLFSTKSILPIKELTSIPREDYFSRLLNLRDRRTIFLTVSGLSHMQTITTVLGNADVFDGMADFADISNACRHVVTELLSDGMRPDDSEEMVNSICACVLGKVSEYTFAVPLFGIELIGIDDLALGSMKIGQMSVEILDAIGVQHAHADVPRLLEANKGYLWLIGSTRGTHNVARERFAELATLTVGMLAVSAASMYRHGAARFRIGVVMSAEEAHGRAVWFGWNDKDRELTTYFSFQKARKFRIDKALAEQFAAAEPFNKAFEILHSSNKTPLEEAIAKAIYWYSDAHRDIVLVMKLVKFWSCVETFFSIFDKDVTQGVSAGLATVLVFGGYQFVPSSEYRTLRAKISDLYGQRSRAVHRGSYCHTSEAEVATLSQWVAWLIINMVTFVKNGYATLQQIKVEVERLDGLEMGMMKG